MDQCLNIVESWTENLLAKNVPGISGTYSENGVLLGTCARAIKDGRSEISEYFTKLFKKDELEVEFIPPFYLKEIGDNTCVYSGKYVFNYVDETGKDRHINARFTFVTKIIDNQPLIITHHSSQIP